MPSRAARAAATAAAAWCAAPLLALSLAGCGAQAIPGCSSPSPARTVAPQFRGAPDFIESGTDPGPRPVCRGGTYIVALRVACPGSHVVVASGSDAIVPLAGTTYPAAVPQQHDQLPPPGPPVTLARVALTPEIWQIRCADASVEAGVFEISWLGPHRRAGTVSPAATVLQSLEASTGCPYHDPCDYHRYFDGLAHLAVPPGADFDLSQLRNLAGFQSCDRCELLSESIMFEAAVREDLGLPANG
jgi:hypothetical protein